METTILFGSKIIIGAQSAVNTPIGIFLWSVIIASHLIILLLIFLEIK